MYALWFCRLKQSWLVRGEFVGVMFIVTCVGRKLLSLYDICKGFVRGHVTFMKVIVGFKEA